ncbi:MAG: hypothetical protein KJO44_05280 [Gemmatimonadetes bacterium]|nr:hypothetical protein [Gemmatimonadota bacterium]NNK63988.1 hypothetical protein [Gemmatimonadota bacterium]
MPTKVTVRSGLVAALLLAGPVHALQTRPQTPQPPFPYDVREIEVAAGAQLSCTLTTPREGSGWPGVVLQTVAGANDRDQSHSGVFQTARTGSMMEYGMLEESFSVEALELITDWIIERFGS